ncbi:trigger factor [Magnetofaba australis]|uniref:Trigger factor n=1 Tax=Magnetofaba australis IT-1 TaxID=1434232 RepID=A0A1Y2JZL1_9PROT|nr:trigger factor [Magnetofaba australis]OSM00347.1 putative trigger factor [Magnetofaba australis IT-1]
MQVTVEEKGAFDRDVIITVPAEQVNAMLDAELSKLAMQAKLPGFRPGRVPRKVIEQRFGHAVKNDVAERLFQTTYPQALSEQSLRPVGMPTLKVGDVTKDADFTYTASIQIFPTIEPQGYTGLKLTRANVEIGGEDVERVIQKIQQHHAEYQPSEEAAEMGDQVRMSFSGSIDGELFPGGQADDYVLDLGSNRFIPGFEEQLVGVKAGEEKDVTVSFPADYHSQELAGKEAVFKCGIKEVKKANMPAVDDELAKKAGIADGGVEKLREEIEKRLKQDAQQTIQNDLKQQIMRQLLEANPVDLPSQLVEQEIDGLVEGMKAQYKQQGIDPDQLNIPEEEMRAEFQDKGRERVTLGLLMGSITRKEELKVDDAAIEARLDALVSSYVQGEQAEQIKKMFREDPKRMEEIQGGALEEKVIDWLIKQAEVSDESLSFEALMERQEGQSA